MPPSAYPDRSSEHHADDSGMSELDDLPMRKATISAQARPLLRRQWLGFALLGWFIVSIYPVYLFVAGTSSLPSMSLLRPSTYGWNNGPTREPLIDFQDAFENFTKTPECSMSSLTLHQPFAPLCETRTDLMAAMSGGGRVGIDAPYQPRGCDMRWFSATEICSILGRFGRVSILGDSMMRNMAAAMFTLLRTDLNNGGRADWLEDPTGVDCRCQGAFEHSQCDFHSAWSSNLVWTYAPDTMSCPRTAADVEYTSLLAYPLEQEHVANWLSQLPSAKPEKPHAFVMGHGLWNDIQANATFAWVEQVEDALRSKMAYLAEEDAYFPRLFITPSAAGDKKPKQFIEHQGNIALSRFEHTVGPWVVQRGYDHLGIFNLTVQAYNADGTHAGMKNNLIKAMMVFNWLNALDTSSFYHA